MSFTFRFSTPTIFSVSSRNSLAMKVSGSAVGALLLCFVLSEVSGARKALLVLSLDGFRPDFLKYANNIASLTRVGVSGVVRPAFPTKTHTDHFTVATGLHADKHGVVANKFFDHKLKRQLEHNWETYKFMKGITPIWTLNQQQGGKSTCMNWHGSKYTYQGQQCDLPRQGTFGKNIDEALERIKGGKADLVMLYTYSPDDLGHAYGAFSPQVIDKVKEYDRVIGGLKKKLTKNGLQNRVNVIIMSDHGMIDVTERSIVDLESAVAPYQCSFYGGAGPILQIIPKRRQDTAVVMGKLRAEAAKTRKFSVYDEKDKQKLAKWKIYNEQRFGPIYTVAKLGYVFHPMWRLIRFLEKKYNFKRKHKIFSNRR